MITGKNIKYINTSQGTGKTGCYRHALTLVPSGPVYSTPSVSSMNKPHPHPNLSMGPPGYIQKDLASSEPETGLEEGSEYIVERERCNFFEDQLWVQVLFFHYT